MRQQVSNSSVVNTHTANSKASALSFRNLKQEDFLHVIGVLLLLIVSMVFLNTYLIMEMEGNEKIGVAVFLIIGDIFTIIIIRFVATRAYGEVEVMKRNRAIIEWCLFVLSSDIKTFFLFEHIYYHCNVNNPTDCNYSTTQMKLLSLLHALVASALYIQLVSVGFMKSSRTHKINQLTLSAFVTIVDLLDIIQLKTSLFELHPDKITFSFPLFIYIYCSFVSIIVVSSFFVQNPRNYLSKRRSYRKLNFIRALTQNSNVYCVHVPTTTFRVILFLIFSCTDASMIFMAKNFLIILLAVIEQIRRKWKKKVADRFNFVNASFTNLSEPSSYTSSRACTLRRQESHTNSPAYFTPNGTLISPKNLSDCYLNSDQVVEVKPKTSSSFHDQLYSSHLNPTQWRLQNDSKTCPNLKQSDEEKSLFKKDQTQEDTINVNIPVSTVKCHFSWDENGLEAVKYMTQINHLIVEDAKFSSPLQIKSLSDNTLNRPCSSTQAYNSDEESFKHICPILSEQVTDIVSNIEEFIEVEKYCTNSVREKVDSDVESTII